MTDNINAFGPAPIDAKQNVQTLKLGVNWSELFGIGEVGTHSSSAEAGL